MENKETKQMIEEIEDMKMLRAIFKAIDDKKGEDIQILDIRGLSTVSDYFVIATSDNKSQMRAIKDNIEEELMKLKLYARSIEGDKDSPWVLMDYKSVIIHIFDRESRSFYDLARVWRDAKPIEFE